MQSVNSTIEQFLSSLFITAQLLSIDEFDTRLSSLINQSQSNAPITLSRLLSLTRLINHGNAIISNYGTNFEYVFASPDTSLTVAETQALTYDDECSCGLLSNCTSEARFIHTNVSLNGLKIGCTASEAFRRSTLECFYDQSCLDLLQENIDVVEWLPALDRKIKRFPTNTTVDNLIGNVFIEDWIILRNYSSYFSSCSPLLCTYSHTEQFNLLYFITLLLGLQGGLSIVFKWICPRLVRLLFKIHLYQTRQITRVQPIFTVPTTTIEDIQTKPKISPFVLLLIMTSLGCIIVLLIIFSIYLAGHDEKPLIATSMNLDRLLIFDFLPF